MVTAEQRKAKLAKESETFECSLTVCEDGDVERGGVTGTHRVVGNAAVLPLLGQSHSTQLQHRPREVDSAHLEVHLVYVHAGSIVAVVGDVCEE